MADQIACALCGKLWHFLDPGVRFMYGDGRFECADESQCFGRIAIQAALDSASEPLRAVAEPPAEGMEVAVIAEAAAEQRPAPGNSSGPSSGLPSAQRTQEQPLSTGFSFRPEGSPK